MKRTLGHRLRRPFAWLLAPALVTTVLALMPVSPAGANSTTAPPVPVGVEVAGGDAAVGLVWVHSQASDRAGYSVYRSTTLPVVTTGTPVAGGGLVKGQEFVDTTVSNGATYHYSVVSVDTFGNRSAGSAPVTVTPAAPAAATGDVIDWTTGAAAVLARAEAQGIASGGKLYVFGGQTSGVRQTKRSDAYDFTTDTWARLPDLPELITHAPVVDDGGTLWLIGGYLGLDKKDSTTHVWRYNTASRTYSRGPDLPAPRGGAAAAIVGRQLHFFSGAVRMDSTGAPTTDHPEHWVLDLDGGTTWTASTPVPNPRNHVSAAVVNGKVYLVGGQHGEFEKTTPQRQVDVFNPATGTWSRAADLPVPRGHISSSMFVYDGRLLVVGGSTVGALASDTVYSYDPATNAWTTRSALPNPRKSPVVGVINGTIVASGGRSDGSSSTTTYRGSLVPPPDPAAVGAWAAAKPALTSRLDAGGVALGGKLYVVAGKNANGPRSELYAFDPAANSWTQLPKLPRTGIENPAVTAWNGQLYVFGGATQAFSGAVSTAFRYDPVTKVWTKLPNMPAGRSGAAAVVVGETAWLLGGMNSSGASLSSTLTFHLPTSTWGTGPTMKVVRDNAAAAVLGNRIHVFGGRTRLANGTEVDGKLTAHETLDPGGTWTLAEPMSHGRRALAAGVIDGRIYAAGGEKQPDGSTMPFNEEYDPTTGTWRDLAPMVTPRHGAVAGVLDGRLHVVTGGKTGGSSYSTVHEVFTPPDVGSDTTAPASPSGLAGAAGAGPQVVLGWTANGEPDLAGYRVFRAGSSPVPVDGAPLSGADLVAAPEYTDSTVVAGSTFHYAVVAVDTTGNASDPSEVAVVVPPDPPPPTPAVRVDFGTSTSPLGEGYLRDWGQQYALRTAAEQGSGLSYGWVRLSDANPVDLRKNSRFRTGTPTEDVRLLGLVHMQWDKSATNGNPTPAAWQLAVENGSYEVTVGLGDAANNFDSVHQLSVEDQNAVAQFVPSDEDRFRTASVTVDVSDGLLTLTPQGGTNTKLLYVDVVRSTDQDAPRVAGVTPPNLATNQPTDTSVVASIEAGPGGGIQPETFTSDSVRLSAAGDGASVAAVVVTSAAGDVISVTPSAPLENGQTYRLEVTSAVTDSAGVPFEPWSSIFTAGSTTTGTGLDGVAFTKETTTARGDYFTSVTTGPDGRLYAATLTGSILRYPIAADGSLGDGTRIDTVADNAGGPRTIIGMAFDPASTAAAPVLWVTENLMYEGTPDVPEWSGRIVRLSGADLQSAEVVVTGLPRSARDHMSNSLAFGPDGALYLNQGSNSAMGAPSTAWADRPERLLTAAVLRLDPALLPAALPLDVQTEGGGTYDPSAAGAALTLYATGVRNAYDLVWHTNGELYVPTNGSARGGNVPGTPAELPASCGARIDGPWTGPATPGITNNPQDETDWVFKVAAGGYYGHPNPTRCEWASHGGNPTSSKDPWEVGAYPVGVQQDRNHRSEDVFNVGLHASANGSVEYLSDVFGPALKGKLIVVRYSASQDIVVLDTSGPDGKILSRTVGVDGFQGFDGPLDVAQHVASGSLYVTELGGQRITRLVPVLP